MKARFDDRQFDLPEFGVEGLRSYLQAVADGMCRAEPDMADCWTWGRAYLGDASNSSHATFQWGGDVDIPDDGLGQWAVVPVSSEDTATSTDTG